MAIILFAASRGHPSAILREAPAAYKVDTDASAAKVRQEFIAKAKGKKEPNQESGSYAQFSAFQSHFPVGRSSLPPPCLQRSFAYRADIELVPVEKIGCGIPKTSKDNRKFKRAQILIGDRYDSARLIARPSWHDIYDNCPSCHSQHINHFETIR